MQDAIIAFAGVILGFILTICWDKYKNHRKYKDLIQLVLIELEANTERMEDVFDKLPQNIKTKFEQDGDSVALNDEEMNSLSWSFPKPYTTEAWQTFVLSGFTIELPKDAAKNLYKTYDQIHSINFLGDLSVRLFQIMSQQNRLDPETNKNFDRFCKMGTISQQIVARNQSKQAIEELKKIL
jgi:hypothetical protein